MSESSSKMNWWTKQPASFHKVSFALYDPFAPIIDRAPLLTVFHKNPKNESRSDAS